MCHLACRSGSGKSVALLHKLAKLICFKTLAKMSLVILLLVCSSLLGALVPGTQGQLIKPAPALGLPVAGGLGLKAFEPFIKSVSDQLKPKPISNPATEAQPLKSLMDAFIPKLIPKVTTTTTTTSTTTTTARPNPLDALTGKLASGKGGIFGVPMNPLDSVFKGADRVTGGLIESTSRLVHSLTGGTVLPDERQYYEYTPIYDPMSFRESKYFSRDCSFRMACEVGRLLKPFGQPFKQTLETSKLVQDLQNRYTRATTFGIVHNDCSRYYCLLVQFVGGPAAFASGIAELLNRMANPEMYEG